MNYRFSVPEAFCASTGDAWSIIIACFKTIVPELTHWVHEANLERATLDTLSVNYYEAPEYILNRKEFRHLKLTTYEGGLIISLKISKRLSLLYCFGNRPETWSDVGSFVLGDSKYSTVYQRTQDGLPTIEILKRTNNKSYSRKQK